MKQEHKQTVKTKLKIYNTRKYKMKCFGLVNHSFCPILCLSITASVPYCVCPILRFMLDISLCKTSAERVSVKSVWGVITTMGRLNDFILGEI